MKLACTKCGALNRLGAFSAESLPRCVHCSALLDLDSAAAQRGRSLASQWILGCLVISLLALLGFWQWLQKEIRVRSSELAKDRVQQRAALETSREPLSANESDVQDSSSSPSRSFALIPEVVSGALAEAHHSEEWKRRQRHDPALARSAVEANLVRMRELGSDTNLTAWQSLFEVATAALPERSRVEVIPEGDGFSMRVAFRMSAMAAGEAGLTTRHRSVDAMRNEARELAAHVVQNIFDFCGARGIRSLSVACNRPVRQAAIPESATEEEKLQLMSKARFRMQAIYRLTVEGAQARGVINWRSLSSHQILEKIAVEADGLSEIRIENLLPNERSQSEPSGELEF